MATVVQPLIEPNVEAVTLHLTKLFTPCLSDYPKGLVEIAHGVNGNLNKANLFPLTKEGMCEAVTYAIEQNRRGENVYVGVNPRKPGTQDNKRASDPDVEIAFWQFADLDHEEAVTLARHRIPLKPSLVVMTGTVPSNRPHLYWQLEEPVSNLEAWSRRQRGIAQTLGGDMVINSSRIMRLAGSVNYPTQDKMVKRGYTTELVTIKTEFADERPPVSPEQITQAFPEQEKRRDDAGGPVELNGQTTLSAMAGGSRSAELIAACQSGVEWHNNMVMLTSHLAGIGTPKAVILGLAPVITLAGYTVEDTAREMQEALQGAYDKGWGSPESEEAPQQSVIELRTVDAFDFEELAIPVRPWIIPGVLLSKHTHMLVAPGGSGKSLFTLQLSIVLATAMFWGNWKPKRRCKVLIINIEDDIDEQRRRLAAARHIMKPDLALLKGMIMLADEPDSIVVARIDPKTKSVFSTPIVGILREFIKLHGIDVIIVDPFAETFEGDENSNSEVKWAMKIWRDEIARPTGCAVYLVHHTTKYAANGAGNADVIRGGGAIVNSTRISSTLFTMTEEEAKALGVPVEDRNRYVRFDDAKANQTLKSGVARWFEKVSVTIGNGGGFDEPDDVGALRPWDPPSAFSGCSINEIHTALAMIERGTEDSDGRPSGVLFTHRTNTKEGTNNERWAGHPIMAAMGVNEERAKLIVKEWVTNKVLIEAEYDDPVQRKMRKGLFVNKDNIPDHGEGVEFR